ncbi:MAG: putative beta-lysine N-acetyltransferase [Rhodothermales bacterium]
MPKATFERLPSPLNGHLTTLDSHNARIKIFGESVDVVAQPEAQEVLQRQFDKNDAYSKLTVYAPDDDARWESLGFRREGRIKGFFQDGSDSYIWSRFSDHLRAVPSNPEAEDQALRIALGKQRVERPAIPEGFALRFAQPEDAEAISELLQATFSDYPSDLSPESIRPMIARQRSVFRLVEQKGELAALASAEIDLGRRNAEITDCTTVEAVRGRGLMVAIIQDLVRYVSRGYKITDFYTLARAEEIGINAAFAKAGFTHDGQLVNNCRMPSGWETMNVWWQVAD